MANSAANDFAYLQIASPSGDVATETSTPLSRRTTIPSGRVSGCASIRPSPTLCSGCRRRRPTTRSPSVSAPLHLPKPTKRRQWSSKGQALRRQAHALVASKAPVAATVVVEAPQSDTEDADQNDGHLSSETSDEDVDAPEDAAMSSKTSEDVEDEEDEQDDVAVEDEASPADDIDMEAAIKRKLVLAYVQAQAASSSSSETDSDSEDNDGDVDIEAETAKELEAAPVEMTLAAPVVDVAAKPRRDAAINEREAQMVAMKKQPTPIAATNKKIDDDDFLGLTRRKTEALFEFRPEFAGAEAKRLFHVQKRLGGDQRFRLGARFVEGDELNDGMGHAGRRRGRQAGVHCSVALSLVFPNMELERATARLHRSVSGAKDLKQLRWRWRSVAADASPEGDADA
ncbi:hypothetical protein SPRG_16429 [Saprolegnia parasitica CBS 223.65]|uniref:Uncharacterized protein n=1 Tax=Saprolegnia parasitica (strain CBS 223.65) TaxID=695850 RepID=A0A067BJ03_SAPPC|nr:hypothetical protein SPRG_16429 [Saprolegnia parasitica CBS 223.65]KDO18163.1 hypothetical protein SPRG_16429 [Saprolegnia parasitica CBS 223.65]|eukprot:XP_012211128.1 hypothetical protein SPRG_16429 [Saprolegnia parasitica CBS 223.65]